MKRLKDTKKAWAAVWTSNNRLDGPRSHFIGDPTTVHLFTSRKRAREYVRQHYGYIAKRGDLRGHPHGWRMPKVVRVTVTVAEQAK